MHANKQVILASSSVYRSRQLQQLGVSFITSTPDIDESPLQSETPEAMAMRLSEAKALRVLHHNRDSLVIGSDQVAELGGKQLTKPLTFDNAFAQLSACSAQRVQFYTGICIATDQLTLTRAVTTTVTFRKLSSTAIDNYLQREAPFDCAGSFKCEGLGIALFESISSDDPSALIGLPLIATNLMLAEHGIDTLT